jgi:hypothetical protein
VALLLHSLSHDRQHFFLKKKQSFAAHQQDHNKGSIIIQIKIKIQLIIIKTILIFGPYDVLLERFVEQRVALIDNEVSQLR